ncbi:MAG: hypothetical protein NTX24_01700 [Candidatus Pacearchaeota archaeon]|nr:hypothetical protein [Candidatus Pacearchaeota archaeon]
MGITKQEAIDIVNEFHEKSTFDDVKPLELALESINNLLEKKHELFVITARPIRLKKKVEDWINHYLKDSSIKIIHSGDFHEGQAANKADICLKLGIGLLLEDKRETVIECAEKGIKVILFDNPWNKNITNPNIFRVSGWREAMKKINDLCEDCTLSHQ